MTDFLTADTNLPSYMMFPRFLLDMEINETAKMLYIILLDRARLSQKNEGWSDIDGHVFIYFTIEALAEVLHKSQMTVKTALAVLEKQELIFRKRQGPGQPNRKAWGMKLVSVGVCICLSVFFVGKQTTFLNYTFLASKVST